ncbi:MAG: molybdenum cofactor guanylyltransferase [Proteobacteria bacterium]|nr:molybdenum cofactor guanylyltransferase [Pseudomonadota bacterium]
MSRKKDQDKGGKTNGIAMQSFSRLPVFLLTGGTENSRADYVRRLMVELTQSSLTAVFHRKGDGSNPYTLTMLAQRYDLVIVNSGIESPETPIMLAAFTGGEAGAPSWSLSWEEGWPRFIAGLLEKLREYGRRTPVWGCVLIGGRSSRMGRPKHLLKDGRGKTWLENTIATLHPLLDGVVISGGGVLPEAVATAHRLPDIPGVVGPLTGILAAGRWQPLVSWLLVACDMPQVSAEAVSWLLAGRRPGCWGRVPKFAGNDRLEPLLAWYDFRSIHLFEEQLYSGNMRIGEAAGDMRIDHPIIPEELCSAWENVNTPEQLQAVER